MGNVSDEEIASSLCLRQIEYGILKGLLLLSNSPFFYAICMLLLPNGWFLSHNILLF